MRREIISTSLVQTESLGRAIGAALKGGEVLQLVSDLGGGKTTLTKSIIAGAGCAEVVTSPTFTISREYKTPQLLIRHFDFYRLSDAGIVGMELAEGFIDEHTVTIIEWADIVQDVLPDRTVTITIEQLADTERHFNIQAPEKQAYLVRGIV